MNIPELHLRRKDFILQWFSGRGAGGQHRNKHQNCCRIIHKETGLSATGQNSRSRVTNQDQAFRALAGLILAHYAHGGKSRRASVDVVRNYHGVRNECKDKASGLIQSYQHVVVDADLSEMIDARAKAMRREGLKI